MSFFDPCEERGDDYPFPNQCVAIVHPYSTAYSKRCGRAASDQIAGHFPVCSKHRHELEAEADPTTNETYQHIERIAISQRYEISNLTRQVRELEDKVRKLAPLGIKPNGLPVERPASYYADKVYFIRCEGFIKIGKAQRPEARVKAIRRGGIKFPTRLDLDTAELIATEPGGLVREKELHARFAHLRHTGEWFREAPELTEYIDTLKESSNATDAA